MYLNSSTKNRTVFTKNLGCEKPDAMANNLTGEWLLKSVTGKIDGEWVSEKVVGGISSYSKEGRFIVFFKTVAMDFGMYGTYLLEGNRLTTVISASSVEMLDGTAQVRDLVFETSDRYKVRTTDPATGIEFENVWERAVHSSPSKA